MAQATGRRYGRVVAPAVVATLLSGTALGVAGTARAAGDDATVTGSAMGYRAEVSLFGGPSSERGPDPVVELAPDGSDSPQEASLAEAAAVYGPAVIFRSGQIDVGTEGTAGPGASVTSYARVQADSG